MGIDTHVVVVRVGFPRITTRRGNKNNTVTTNSVSKNGTESIRMCISMHIPQKKGGFTSSMMTAKLIRSYVSTWKKEHTVCVRYKARRSKDRRAFFFFLFFFSLRLKQPDLRITRHFSFLFNESVAIQLLTRPRNLTLVKEVVCGLYTETHNRTNPNDFFNL